ncbi:MAG TPA: GntR family transcriptional regulator, partial [Xanthomonadales bacterium]|nr:GntR family transcriptional regulator [Xanthomonadales bacterium]
MSSELFSQQAYEQLKHRIITCELEPGGYYTEAGLAADLQLGKTPTREALMRLAREDWVQSVKGRGYRVQSLSLAGIRELFGARLVLEPAAVFEAAGRLTPDEVRQLRQICGTTFDLTEPEERLEYLQANHAIHMGIVAGCRNKLLNDMVRQLLERSQRLLYIGMVVTEWNQVAARHHEEIVDAVAGGEALLARTLITEHIAAAEK